MTYCGFHRTPTGIGLTLILACFSFVGCGSKTPPHTTTGTAALPAPPAVAAPTAPTLRDATRAENEGRPGEALALYESIATLQPPGSTRVPALMGAARLRLSMNPTLRDVSKAREYLAGAASVDPRQPATLPAADLISLLDDAAALREQQATLKEQADQRAAALRTENRALKTTIKTLQDELAKKDEALHRATDKLLGKTPPPRK